MEASALDEGRDSVIRPRVAVSGAGGLIGAALLPRLREKGYDVTRLVRRRLSVEPEAVYWNPDTREIDARALEGFRGVIHLAGENLAAGRWSRSRKARIRDSRVEGTRIVAQGLAGLRRPPRVLISASAIGFYGDRGDEALDERSVSGTGFLAELSREWEAATEPAERAGIRVVHARIGVVLAGHGGALERMLPVFRRRLGGAVGSGRQFVSWISLPDVARALVKLLEEQGISGPVNLVAPEPVTNRELSRALGRVLHRPAVLPVPAFVIGLAFGEMGRETVLSGARILPRRLERAGFVFEYPRVEDALRHALASGGT